MNSAGDDTSVNIFENMDNITKIQLVSYYYNVSLADTLKFIQLNVILSGKIQLYIWEKSAFTPVFEEIIKNHKKFSPQMIITVTFCQNLTLLEQCFDIFCFVGAIC